jgi:hypothetical protein
MHFFLFRPIVALNPALLSWQMLIFVSLRAMLGTSQRSTFVPQINIVLLLGAPIMPTVSKDLDIFAVGAVSLDHIL